MTKIWSVDMFGSIIEYDDGDKFISHIFEELVNFEEDGEGFGLE